MYDGGGETNKLFNDDNDVKPIVWQNLTVEENFFFYAPRLDEFAGLFLADNSNERILYNIHDRFSDRKYTMTIKISVLYFVHTFIFFSAPLTARRGFLTAPDRILETGFIFPNRFTNNNYSSPSGRNYNTTNTS